jgi:hypothetical protein
MNKNIITATFSIIIFTVVILTAINFHNNDVLEARINTLSKYKNLKISALDSGKSFKEDYYIQQQSHDTNVILVVFGLVVAVMGFFTYQNVVTKFDFTIVQLRNEITAHKNETVVVFDELANLQVEFYLQSAELLKETARSSKYKGNTQMFVYFSIASISKIADLCLWGMEERNSKFNLVNIESITNEVLEALTKLDKSLRDPVEINRASLDVLDHYILNIRKVKSMEANKLLSNIHSKLKEREQTPSS